MTGHLQGRIRPAYRCGLRWGLCLLVAAGCSRPQSDNRIGAEDTKQKEMTRVEVPLPPAPTFAKDHAPERYPDGALSIHGLRRNPDAMIDQEVTLRATVVDIYTCPTCPKGAECKPCTEPHFWVADRANVDRDQAMMVVDLPEKKPVIEIGQRYLFSGTFSKGSAAGFRASDGLLVYAKHEVEGKDP